ncbi:MAG: CDP-alcohol phosphatidyltransferase family protein [Vicinamibacterales bacterium]|nr:CDP-alcohol phosphatidyltransferase family protein [Vicinamibacterales bacterium]
MFDETARGRFASLAAPVARWFAARRVSAAQMTAVGLVLALAAAVFVALAQPWVGLGLWLASRVADGLDGQLARASGGGSPLGGYLDITADMIAYSAMVLGFAAAHPRHGLLWAAVLAGYVLAITTTLALAAAAERVGRQVSATDRSLQFTRGLAEAGETTIVYALWVAWPAGIAWVGWTWVALLAATAVQRTAFAVRALR